jgi:hypothetical protein
MDRKLKTGVVMRNSPIKFLISVLLLILSGCVCGKLEKEYPESFNLKITNGIDIQRKDASVFVDIPTIKEKHPDFNPGAFVVVEDKKELASQLVNSDTEGQKIIFVTDFSPKETKNLTIRYAKEGSKIREYPRRTQGELAIKTGGKWVGNKYEGGKFKDTNYLEVPSEHTVHSEYIRFEGPGWESDKVGYRLYLDLRNATDIFGKKIDNLVLQDVGLDDFDSYHEMSPWGMDILKVGDALGIGAVGIWENGKAQNVSKTEKLICEILADGPVYSLLRIKYPGWETSSGKYDLTSELSITAGSRLTKHDINVNKDIENLCTGIVKSDQVNIIKSEGKEGDWSFLATYGNQSIIGDKLGMAVLYRNEDEVMVAEDELNNVVVLKTRAGKLIYYFLAAWEQEPEGIKNEEEFIDYLEKLIKELDSPFSVEIQNH